MTKPANLQGPDNPVTPVTPGTDSLDNMDQRDPKPAQQPAPVIPAPATIPTVTSKGAERMVTQVEQPYVEVGTTAPRAAAAKDRLERRAKQEAAKVQAREELQRKPPRGAEKREGIARAQAEEMARFGGAKNRRAVVQAEHKAQAEVEAVELAAPKLVDIRTVVGNVKPGTMLTPFQLRQWAKAQERGLKDPINDAARAAGRAVRDVLVGRNLRGNPHARYRTIAEQQVALATARASKAKANAT